jgi:hypothetical protein
LQGLTQNILEVRVAGDVADGVVDAV